MLYDNALLAFAYMEAFLATGKEKYGDIVKRVFEYILRDMVSDKGGFFTAEDADSEGVEGKFYVWTPDEVKNILGQKDGEFYCNYYDITKEGNFEGKSIPNLIHSKNKIEVDDKELSERLESYRKKLFDYREKRIHPYKDDKILTSWNGLMIAAIAIGGRVFNNEEYTKAAENAMEFIMSKLIREDGRMLARYREGEAKYPAYLDDYAFIVWALLELFETTGNIKYLNKAEKLNEDMIKLFMDKEKGGFFLYGNDGEELIMRPKEIYDGAIPSGNSVATYNLTRLSHILEDERLEEIASKQFEVFGGSINSSPMAYSFMLIALESLRRSGNKIVLVGNQNDRDYVEIKREIDNKYLPFTTKIFIDKSSDRLNMLKEKFKDYSIIKGKICAYICKDFTCLEPINEKEKILEIIKVL